MADSGIENPEASSPLERRRLLQHLHDQDAEAQDAEAPPPAPGPTPG